MQDPESFRELCARQQSVATGDTRLPQNPSTAEALGPLPKEELERKAAASDHFDAHCKTSALISDLTGVLDAAYTLAVDTRALSNDQPEAHSIRVLIDVARNMAKSAIDTHETEFAASRKRSV